MIAWIKRLFRRTPKPVPAYDNVTMQSDGNRRWLEVVPPATQRRGYDPLNMGLSGKSYEPAPAPKVTKAQAAANQAAERERVQKILARDRVVQKSPHLAAAYSPAPSRDTSSDDIYLATAAMLFASSSPPPAPEPEICRAPSFSSGGGGDFGGGGASSSWDSGSSSSSDSGSSSSSSD